LRQCPTCAAAVEEDSRFCRACCATLSETGAGTPLSATTPLQSVDAPAGRSSKRADDDATPRFLPGTMLHGRYRIVGLLGRGGMGEVYRADDIKLGQAVALKFLPESLARDADALQRFYAEVRLGRQVSHPNVCRLYDLVEIDGHHCLAMEYVDGEDLSTLLRRIGRLPVDKAVDFARDLTAGLAAAHDKGVIHRDLKPANIMIDGEGRARITDFGIAALAEGIEHADFAGTLIYMAPEQLDGAPASVRTDLYALGLVLYEAFTGKRLFDAPTPGELKALHARTQPPSLSSHVRDVPPAVEHIVQMCLARDPYARPSSARMVLAALPGGDPLQAALAAGETPTPAMVAAAGKTGDLKPPIAWGLLLAAFAGLILIAALAARTTVIGRLQPELSPELLSAKAEQVLTLFGYPSPPVDRAGLFWFDHAYLDARAAHGNTAQSWQGIEKAHPGPLLFVYRGGQQTLVAKQYAQMIFSPADVGLVRPDDPPLSLPGMTRVTLDRHGRLVAFVGVPPDKEDTVATRSFDWSAALAAAGLDASRLRPGKPRWTAPTDSDSKQAWDGAYADQPDVTFHIEAAAYRGKPVWFAVLGPWYRPRAPDLPPSGALNPVWWVTLVLGTAIMIVLIAMARRNLYLGRGDRKGAVRLAVIMYAGLSIALLVRADHATSIVDEIPLLMNVFVQAAFFGLDIWLIYVAFEPFGRRRWPHLMISWSRLLAGRLRDPMVGRDLLLGVLGGIVMVLLIHMPIALPSGLGHVQPPPIAQTITTLTANHHMVFFFLESFYESLVFGIGVLAFLFLAIRFLRIPLLAHLVTFAFFGLLIVLTTLTTSSPEYMLLVVVWYWLLMRVGVLAASVAVYVMQVLLVMPLTLDMHAWYAERTVIVFGVVGALLVYAFWISLGGKSPFGTAFLDHDSA
jgi:serine/threonine-protein kinase